MRRGDFSET